MPAPVGDHRGELARAGAARADEFVDARRGQRAERGVRAGERATGEHADHGEDEQQRRVRRSGHARYSASVVSVPAAGGSGSSTGCGLVQADRAEYPVVRAALGSAAGRLVPGGVEVGEDAPLQREHLAFLGGFGVVVTEQVQHAVHGEQVQLVEQAVPGLLGLVAGERRAQHDVTEQGGARVGGIRAARRVQFVHREGHHVGGAFQVHPPFMQVRHDVEVDEQYGQLGQRAYAHPVQREAGGGDDRGLVDADTRFIGDLDTHALTVSLPAP